MVVVVVGVESGAPAAHIGGAHLAFVGGQRDHLVAGVLDGTGLVGGDVTGGGGHHALPALQHGCDDDGVGLSAAGEKVHICIRAGAGGADLFLCAGTVGVGAVAGHFFKVGLDQLFQHSGVCTLAIIVFKI